MPDLPLVSIVTPSFNQGQFLEETIRSVLDQDYPHVEYLVIDGGSTDESPDIIQRYTNRLAYWVCEPDRGQSHAINKGLQRAQGQILGWLNSDDVLFPGTVSRIVNAFQEHPEVDVIYGHLERMDAESRTIPTPILPKDQIDFSLQNAFRECIVNQPGSFWQREITEKVGLLDETLHYSMDYEYWLRMALAGAQFYHLDGIVARFRVGEHAKTSRQTASMSQESLSILARYLTQSGLEARIGRTYSEIKKQANHGRAVISLNACIGCLRGGNIMQALEWLVRAHRYNPAVLIDRRWFDLLAAHQRRS